MRKRAFSVSGIWIFLGEEQWSHITTEHPEMKGKSELILAAIEEPTLVVEGHFGELAAIRQVSESRWLVVVYRELQADGFVITAFFIGSPRYYLNRTQVWP